MNKFSIIEKIDQALENANIKIAGATSIDLPIDQPEPSEIFVYDMSYSNFSRKLVAVYLVSEDKAVEPWF